MAYRPYTDGIFFGIERVDEPPDERDTFARLADARRCLVRRLRQNAAEYQRSARDAAKIRLEDVQNPDV